MTAEALTPDVAGRSLWADAWARLRKNRAAVCSAVYVALMAAACIIGPWLAPHPYYAVYQDYVRVPPSLEPYPREEMIEPLLRHALHRARVELAEWERNGNRLTVTVTSERPIDERIVRYLDRSDAFQRAEVVGTSDDARKVTL